jgi:hypothetical protein
MVVPDGYRAVAVRIGVDIRNLFRRHVHVGRMVIVVRVGERDGGPVGGMPQLVLRRRQAMQVHGRQDGDAQTDAEGAKDVRQIRAPRAL